MKVRGEIRELKKGRLNAVFEPKFTAYTGLYKSGQADDAIFHAVYRTSVLGF